VNRTGAAVEWLVPGFGNEADGILGAVDLSILIKQPGAKSIQNDLISRRTF